MVERLIHVTTGYFKFTAIILLSGTILFFVAAMAMAQPKNLAIILVVSILAFLVVRMEIKSIRQRPKLANYEGPDIDPDLMSAFKEIMALGGAAQAIIEGNAEPAKLSKPRKRLSRILVAELVMAIDDAGDEIERTVFEAIHKDRSRLQRFGIDMFFVTRLGQAETISRLLERRKYPVPDLKIRRDEKSNRMLVTAVFRLSISNTDHQLQLEQLRKTIAASDLYLKHAAVLDQLEEG